jgi:hypothetical protein
MEKVSNTFIQTKNPFLQVYLVRPSKCQEPAGFWKTLAKAGSSKCDLWDLASRFFSEMNLQVLARSHTSDLLDPAS